MSLDMQIERLSRAAHSIRASSSKLARLEEPGPFTNALLNTDVGDLVRDSDPTEPGLFTLVKPSTPAVATWRDADALPVTDVKRINVANATPLRRPPAPKPDAPRGTALGDHEPEEYVRAAIKLIDAHVAWLPLPRARAQAETMLEQIEEIRANIHSLDATLRQASAAGPSSRGDPSTIDSLEAEMRRTQQLELQLKELKQRKEELASKQPAFYPARSPRKPISHSPRKTAGQKTAGAKEDVFWTTPSSKLSRLSKTAGLLMDETLDISNVTASFDSPLAHRTPRATLARSFPSPSVPQGGFLRMGAFAAPEDDSEENTEEEELSEQAADESVDEQEYESHDATVMLSNAPMTPPPAPAEEPVAEPAADDSASLIEVERIDPPAVMVEATPSKSHIRLSNELERIVKRIWATVGDIIMPRNTYEIEGNESDLAPPRAKRTIAHLKEVASQTPQPPSLKAPSLLSTTETDTGPPQVTPEQVLYAQMLLALLAASPAFSLPLAEVKKALGAPVGAGAAGGVATKVIYGCVAKRLIKIERGKGGQVVRFDLD